MAPFLGSGSLNLRWVFALCWASRCVRPKCCPGVRAAIVGWHWQGLLGTTSLKRQQRFAAVPGSERQPWPDASTRLTANDRPVAGYNLSAAVTIVWRRARRGYGTRQPFARLVQAPLAARRHLKSAAGARPGYRLWHRRDCAESPQTTTVVRAPRPRTRQECERVARRGLPLGRPVGLGRLRPVVRVASALSRQGVA